MYRNHFGLAHKPFRIAPSPKFLFASETHDESRARILYGIRESRGFVVVSGGIGLGKTTVLLSVLEELENRVRTAFVFQPVDDFHQLLRLVGLEFGIDTEGRDEIDLLRTLNAYLIGRMAEGESCVLLIDEAQNLSLELLEKIRTLSNLQTDEVSLLQIVLVGQPELYEKLMDPRLVQLRQRVGVWHEISALDADESFEYIQHRLRLAGATRPDKILSRKICHRVHALSAGVPRLINQLCDTALVMAFARDADGVQGEHLEEAARELHLLDLAAPPIPASSPRHRSKGLGPTSWFSWTMLRRWAPTAAIVLLAAAALWLLGRSGMERLGAATDTPLAQPLVREASTPAESESLPAVKLGEAIGDMELAAASMSELDEDVGGGPAEQVAEQLPEAVELADANPAPVEPPVETVEPSVETVQLANDARQAPPSPSPDQLELNRRLDDAEGWRDSGKRIYSVHVHSFLSREKAQSFVEELAAGGGWSQPVYVERTGSEPTWYRVLAGAFVDVGAARSWVATLKERWGLHYTQLMPLGVDAEILLPTGNSPSMAASAGVGG